LKNVSKKRLKKLFTSLYFLTIKKWVENGVSSIKKASVVIVQKDFLKNNIVNIVGEKL